jgi:hypothetical protein
LFAFVSTIYLFLLHHFFEIRLYRCFNWSTLNVN